MLCCKRVYTGWRTAKLTGSVWTNAYFWYRKDPVPGTACYKVSKRSCFRKMKTTAERKENCNPEYKEYIRPARRNLVEFWDDVNTRVPENWKDSTKKKRQWM